MRKLILLCVVAGLTLLEPYSLSALELPFEPDGWQILGYRNIPTHEVTFSEAGMEVQINGSASPLIFPLPKPGRFSRMSVSATIDGTINLNGLTQGEKRGDDFRLRVGLVYAGHKTLNFLQRSIAPQWVKKLYSLAPGGAGISRVEFFNTWLNPSLKGQQRFHPTTKLWREHFILSTDLNGEIDQTIIIPTDADIVAVWISSDGDDTDSSYRVTIRSVILDPV